MLDFVSTYLPSAQDLTAEDMQRMRENLRTWLQPTVPELDMRPGSVFGQWALDPLARLLAGIEIGLDRLRQDLDVGGVAAGTVHDCAFVERRLLALGGRAQESIRSIGYVRLEFSTNENRDLPGGITFQFNGADMFLPLTFPAGIIRVRRVGTSAADNSVLPLRMLASGRYAVVLPVTGYTAEVAAGDQAAVSQEVEGLVAVTAVADFVGGRQNNSVPAIARRTAQTFYASGFASPGTIRRQLMEQLPDLAGVSATCAGDAEMVRSSATALGAADSAVDVHVRSQCRAVISQTVRVGYVADQSAAAVGKFLGSWTPLAVPTRLVSVRWNGRQDLGLTCQLISRSADPARAPLLGCAYSALELFTLAIDMPRNAQGLPLVDMSQDAEGSYAWFTITYEADPGVRTVQTFIDNEDPAGMDVLARAPMQVIIERMRFQHTKDPGVMFNQEQAREDIEAYVSTLFAPATFNPADINDRVFSAGAERITKVDVTARLRLSVSDLVLDHDAPDPLEDYAGAMAAARAVPVLILTGPDSLNPVYTDPFAGTSQATLGAAGRRNIAYSLLDDALAFQHVDS